MGDGTVNRRVFLQGLGAAAAAGTVCALAPAAGAAHGAGGHLRPADPMGVLVDLTLCVGCRLCEHGCKKANGIEPGPLESYEDASVFRHQRRPGIEAFTVVNAWTPGTPGGGGTPGGPGAPASSGTAASQSGSASGGPSGGQSGGNSGGTSGGPVYAKVNCLHCNYPACVSACIVGALRKQENGAVTYEAWKCIGCRYCMAACPFQIPAYEYDDAFTPRVRKCTFCFTRTTQGQPPACVEACPRDALRYGKRREVLALAHQRMAEHPGQYVEQVYGEREVGGTSWLYLSGVPFEQVGFLKLGHEAPPVVTESIQHGVFKHGLPPLALYGLLGGMMWYTGRKRAVAGEGAGQTNGCHALSAALGGQGVSDGFQGHALATQSGVQGVAPGAVALVAVEEPLTRSAPPDSADHPLPAQSSGARVETAPSPRGSDPRIRGEGGPALLDRVRGSSEGQEGGALAVVAVDEPLTRSAYADHPLPAQSSGERVNTLPAQSGGAREHSAHPHPDSHPQPQPVARSLFTPGVFLLLGLALIGLVAGMRRFLFGLGAGTNLDQQHPWGLWIAIDVASGVALAAGGFTSAFLTHVLHRERYHAIARPALLTAMLGYTFVCIGLQADLGRYYNVWHPMFMWQGNSVLFEVGMCVMCYLNVLYLEFAPIACERVIAESKRFPRLAPVGRLAQRFQSKIEPVMFLLVIAGCCLSCLHQSSLGNLLIIAPSKLHPLWWTPLSPLLFLLSAIAVGFPMVIWESLFAGWSLKLKPEMEVLSPLARFIPFTLGLYLAVKIGDMMHRGTYRYLGDGSVQSISWLVEVGLGVALPLAMLAWPRVRRSPRLLFAAASLVVAGVVLNRVNVFLIGFRPPYAARTYWPSAGEWAVTIGLGAALMLAYRVIVTFLPVIAPHPKGVQHAS